MVSFILFVFHSLTPSIFVALFLTKPEAIKNYIKFFIFKIKILPVSIHNIPSIAF